MSVPESAAAVPPALARYPRSVLVVDDDPSVRTLLELVLTAEGFVVRCVPDGAAALESVAAARPDVLLVDVMMPGLDGRALTRQLRDDPSTHDLPVVICSAIADDREQWEAWASGANSFVSKPFDIDTLVAELADAYGSTMTTSG